MSVIHDPVARANAVTTATQAKKLADTLEAELATNPNLSPEWEAQAEQAVSILRARPDFDDELQYEGEIPLSREAQGAMGSPERSGAGSPARAQRRRPAAGGSGRRARSPRGGLGAAALGFTGGRYLERTRIPSATRSGTALALEFIGGAVGLSLLYLLLTRASTGPRGGSALELALNNTVAAFDRILLPVDPLRPPPSRNAPKKKATATRK